MEQALSRLEVACGVADERDLFLSADVNRLDRRETVNQQVGRQIDVIIERFERLGRIVENGE